MTLRTAVFWGLCLAVEDHFFDTPSAAVLEDVETTLVYAAFLHGLKAARLALMDAGVVPYAAEALDWGRQGLDGGVL